MKLATTTGDFSRYFSHADCIRALHEAGFRHIDLSFYHDNTPDSPFMQPDWRDYALGLKALAESLGMDFVQAHAPDFNPLRFDDTWEFAVACTIRSIEVCALLDIPVSVFHTGWADGLDKETYFRENMRFLRRLFPAMEAHQVTLCIENSTRANMGHRYYFFAGQDMVDFLRYADHPLLGACWDTGHANIEGRQYADILALGKDLRALHINDNQGRMDEHIMPYMGSLNLGEVMDALRDINYQGAFTFECDNSLPKHNGWPHGRNPWPQNERLCDPPLFLQQHMEKAMYALGEHVLTVCGYPVE